MPCDKAGKKEDPRHTKDPCKSYRRDLGGLELAKIMQNVCEYLQRRGSTVPYTPKGFSDLQVVRRPRRRGFHPWVGKISWSRTWQPHQYSCLETPIHRAACQATVPGVTKRQTQLSVHVITINKITNYYAASIYEGQEMPPCCTRTSPL